MPTNVPNWWTDERVDATVNREYVYSQLRTDEQELLKSSPSFGAGLTDDTYLDWILTKARRFFLTLVDAGVPDQIFGIVDDSYDDGDLPIEEGSIADLRLSYEPNATLNKCFYKAQYRYLLRVLEEGEHIRYADEETIPVYASGLKATILSLGKDDVDKVRLSDSTSRYFVRKKINIDHRPSGISEALVLGEIASLRRYAHLHLLSVFASFLHQDSVYVLFTPAPAFSLKSFVSDVPKSFDNLPKSQRRCTLISWPHCLASALKWLHINGRHHGAIRPSNIQVTDNEFQIYLGQFDDPGVLGTHTKVDDIESYQYAAPERWKRAVTMQTTAPSKVMGASGGRTARRVKPEKSISDDGSSGQSPRSSWSAEQHRVDTMNPTSTTYSFMPTSRGNFSRLQLSRSSDTSLASDEVSITVRSRANTTERNMPYSAQQSSQNNTRSQIPSAMSNTSSGSNRTIKAAAKNSKFAAVPEVKTAVVQTWASTQHDLLAADIFSVGAVIMDIVTLLCKKSAGSFARHRSAKNRNAGRGGGLADASFHANIGQVVIWGTQLQTYAADRAKKEDGDVFKALGPIIQLVKRCLEREPEERLQSADLERRLGEYVSTFAGVEYLHCSPAPAPETKHRASSRNQFETRSTGERSLVPTIEGDFPQISGELPHYQRDQWSHLRSRGLTTTTIPSPGPESSFSSLSSFNFEYDVQSDTIVNEDTSVVSKSSRAQDQYRDEIDPKLRMYADSTAFSHANYSASESTESQLNESFLLPASRPTSMHPGFLPPPAPPPTRALPAAPNLGRQRSQARDSASPFQPRPSSLEPKQEDRGKALKEDDFQELSLNNSSAPQKRRQMMGKGKSFFKNL